MENVEKYWDMIIPMLLEYGPKLLLAIITLLIGLWVIKLVVRSLGKMMDRSNVDASLKPFFISLIGMTLKVLLVISVMSMVGIAMTSFIAILGAVGLAVGMALSGTLQNFAGGVMILIFKPFKVGDFIDAAGHMGTVKEIQIFNTILNTPDNKQIIIPNGQLSNTSMTNFSAKETRRVDITFGIGYGDDIDKAKKVISDVFLKDERVLKDPEFFIGVIELGDSSVNLVTRSWVNAADYWGVYFDNMEAVKKALDANSISIPFPQRDVHVFQQSK